MASKNLLFILSDEHQSGAMSCAGHPIVQTPNLDRLAARGQRFTSAYTTSPICVPARASIATGRFVHETGNWDNSMAYDGSDRGWAHGLRDHGVNVEAIGKLHFRGAQFDTGFSRQISPLHVKDGTGAVWASIRNPLPAPRSDLILFDKLGAGYSAYNAFDDRVRDETIARIHEAARTGEPFMLHVGFVAPHYPLVVPQKYLDLYPEDEMPLPEMMPRDGYTRHPWLQDQSEFLFMDREFGNDDAKRRKAIASYYGLCTMPDAHIGAILDAVEEAGLADETTVVYSSDHGENLGRRGMWAKSNLYRESSEVPLIVARPDEVSGINTTPVSLIDLAPTFLEHFGLSDDTLPGTSLYRTIDENPDPDRAVFCEYHAWGCPTGAYMIRQGTWKYHHYIGYPPELFDIAKDPDERTNLAADPAYADILEMLSATLHRFCDPAAVDQSASAAQAKLIESYGGREVAYTLGEAGATPPPSS